MKIILVVIVVLVTGTLFFIFSVLLFRFLSCRFQHEIYIDDQNNFKNSIDKSNSIEPCDEDVSYNNDADFIKYFGDITLEPSKERIDNSLNSK